MKRHIDAAAEATSKTKSASGSSPVHPAFAELASHLESYQASLRAKKERGVVVFPPSEMQSAARILFQNIRKGGVATFIVPGRNSWNPRDPYFEYVRDAARRGCNITRIFLVPHKQYLRENPLDLHSKLDSAAGINTRFIHVGPQLSGMSIPPPYTLDFGIWDDVFVCFVYYRAYGGNIGPHEWRISQQPEDMEYAASLVKELSEFGTELDLKALEQELNLEEPLSKSAPLMSMIAEVMCRGSQVCREDCSWYHGIWQYLRLVDMVSTPTWHSGFYINALRTLGRMPARILISGAADYSILAHVLWAYRDRTECPEIVVTDLCQTPLIMCKWYATRLSKNVETVQTDILRMRGGRRFDLIVTDAFLTRFKKNGRKRMVKRWFDLLKVGGKVITTVRIEEAKGKLEASPDEVLSFRERAFKSAQQWQDFISESADEIANKAELYARRMISYPLKSEEEVIELFEGAGFSMSCCDLATVKGEMHETTYVELVATKTHD